jgi:hypothetical protein
VTQTAIAAGSPQSRRSVAPERALAEGHAAAPLGTWLAAARVVAACYLSPGDDPRRDPEATVMIDEIQCRLDTV